MKPSVVIIGLGNPGAQYDRTRHNVGFAAVDALGDALEEGEWQDMQKFDAIGRESRIITVPTLLLKPTTYMNLSGNAVRKVVNFYKLDPATQLLLLTDDVDLPLGELRLRRKGGPGTHNGLKSVYDIYGEAFPRLRIGLGTPPPGADLAAWVLSVPPPDEQRVLADAVQRVPDMIRDFVVNGDQ